MFRNFIEHMVQPNAFSMYKFRSRIKFLMSLIWGLYTDRPVQMILYGPYKFYDKMLEPQTKLFYTTKITNKNYKRNHKQTHTPTKEHRIYTVFLSCGYTHGRENTFHYQQERITIWLSTSHDHFDLFIQAITILTNLQEEEHICVRKQFLATHLFSGLLSCVLNMCLVMCQQL